MADAPFDAQNAGYAQLLYEQFARNPESVPEAWQKFFSLGTSAAAAHGLLTPESLDNGAVVAAEPLRVEVKSKEDEERLQRLLGIVSRATSFIQAFRDHGHMLAGIDPLGSPPPGHPQLDPTFFGTTFEELEQIPADVVLDNAAGDERLSQALARFRTAYADYIGYEFEHIEDPARVRWLWDQVESGVHTQPLPEADARWLLDRLTQVEGFEQFLHRAYLGQKRFSIEGTDMLVPMIDLAVEETARPAGAGRDRHGAPGPAQRPRAHPRGVLRGAAPSLRGRRSEGRTQRRRHRRREVPLRGTRRLQAPLRREDQGHPRPEPLAPRVREPRGRGDDPGAPVRHRQRRRRPGSWTASSRS
jgi:hypothetical protein